MKKTMNNTTNSVIYSGEVSIKILRKKKVIYSEAFYNSGTNSLFKFITNCLAGKFSEVTRLVPKYIKAYYATEEKAKILEAINNGNESIIASSLGTVLTTNAIIYDEVPIPQNGTVTFKFTIPYTRLNNTAELNLLCLMPDSEFLADISAIFELPTAKTLSAEDTLIVTWTLGIDNKEEKENGK